jgi:hypothetical protein
MLPRLRIVTDQTTLPHAEAARLAAMLKERGYEIGAPDCVPPAAVGIDARSYRRCPECHRNARNWRPYHRGGTYVGLAQCMACGAAELC